MHGRLKGLELWPKLLRFKSPILGVDITPTAIHLLKIIKKKNRIVIESYGKEILPLHAVVGNSIQEIELVVGSIKNLSKKLRVTTIPVALALPDAAIISKVICVEQSASAQVIEELILIEAEKSIPYPIHEINLDFEILGPSAKKPNSFDVLVVASRAENVAHRVELLKCAGLDVLIMDVESYAMERAARNFITEFPNWSSNRLTAIITIRINYIHLIVMRGIKLIYSREDKFNGGFEGIEVINSSKSTLLLQIQQAFHFFYSIHHEVVIDHILLASNVMRAQNLDLLIQDHFKAPVNLVNPFMGMYLGRKVPEKLLYDEAPNLLVTCGLALRNLG